MARPTEATALIRSLIRYELAIPVLNALAEGPKRYRDLINALGEAGAGPVYSRTLHNALHQLATERLIIGDHQPRLARYTITAYGRAVADGLDVFQRIVDRHQPKPPPSTRQ